MPKNSIDLFLFDVGNVVILSDETISREMLISKGISQERAKTSHTNVAYWDFSRGRLTGQEFHRLLVEEYFQHPISYEETITAFKDAIYDTDLEVLKVLSSLSKDGRNIAFLTDTNTWQTEKEKKLVDLTSFSRTIYRSNETGMLKVDDGCFTYVLGQLNVSPERILFVDDSAKKIEKAGKHGLQTHLYENAQSLRTDLTGRGII